MENEYADWTGAGVVTDCKLFDTATKQPLEIGEYPTIQRYLPLESESQNTNVHYLVARVATKSKKSDPPKDIVKIFTNASWSGDLRRALESMEFTKSGNDIDHLISDIPVVIDAGDWQANGKIEVFRKLVPGKPMAKIVFRNEKTGKSISAFWCWPS